MSKYRGLVIGGTIACAASTQCWIYRDDIGQRRGIKGYEELALIDRLEWPYEKYFSAYNASTIRRGFLVFAKSCNNCHAMLSAKYDYLIKKGFRQKELGEMVKELAPINPAHWLCKGFFRQEWEERDRRISDTIFAPYLSGDEAKNANGGALPSDLSRLAVSKAGGSGYIYNIMTGYHFQPPYGVDVPEGKFFNPYFSHMIIGMPKPLYDGLIDYPDGTPASVPQMSYDVATFCHFMAAKDGLEYRMMWLKFFLITMTILPFQAYCWYLEKAGGVVGVRSEMYNVSDGYKKWKYHSRFYGHYNYSKPMVYLFRR